MAFDNNSTDDQEIFSFPYVQMVNGVEHHFRITQSHDKCDIEKDGVLIAEIAYNESWSQISGATLSTELLGSIGDHIESYYS